MWGCEALPCSGLGFRVKGLNPNPLNPALEWAWSMEIADK
jgi:hypothetical protein